MTKPGPEHIDYPNPETRWITPRHVEFTYPQGSLVANYIHELGVFNIADIIVDSEQDRGRGLGETLIRYAKNYAEEQTNASEIWAQIVSREAYDAITRVFGAKYIKLQALGDYAKSADGGTASEDSKPIRAVLTYPIRH